MITVAASQPAEILCDPLAAVELMVAESRHAASLGAKLICFPECFLQGYLLSYEDSRRLAMPLNSKAFEALLANFSMLDMTVVFGMIEREGDDFYNTAVVIKRGQLLGRYRKTELLAGEARVFSAGGDYPTFMVEDVCFGVNICKDLNYPALSAKVASLGASLLVCPCNNMLKHEAAIEWKDKHNEIRSQRCVESGLWLLSSDVTGNRDDRVALGPTALIDPTGKVVAQAVLEKPGMIVYQISN